MRQEFDDSGWTMSRLIEDHDWSTTDLGPREKWPLSLQTAVGIILGSRYPMFLWWGPSLVNIYNDAYIPVLGARHPAALGAAAPEIWAEIWDTVGPQADIVLRQGRATWNEQLLLIMQRYGYEEETYFTFSYSPVRDDDGQVAGVFCACSEDTQRVLGQRHLGTLRELSSRTAEARSVEEACRQAVSALALTPQSLPFSAIYLLREGGSTAELSAVEGLPPDSPACPVAIELVENDCWELNRVLTDGQPRLVQDLEARFGELPSEAWSRPTTSAVVLPIPHSGRGALAGFLILGLNPYRQFDEDYRSFTALVAEQVATALANARSHQEERERAEALAMLDRAKTAFFSNVSHEFRTPLTLLVGPLDDLRNDTVEPLPPRQQERLEIAHRNSLRLLRLVNTLLDFSRIEAGRVMAQFRPVDLAVCTAELASNFRSACERAGLELVVNCPDLPQPVYVDTEMWEKIVLNLVSNAFKFTLKGRIEVSVAAGQDGVELIVRDTGVGVPADQVPRLFERFHRVEGVRGRTQEGTGIGLALVRELARLHGGDVTAESREGEGSEFRVLLPWGCEHLPAEQVNAVEKRSSTAIGAEPFLEEALRWLPDDENDAAAETSGNPLDVIGEDAASADGGSRPKILLADDNADMRQYVRRLLSSQYDVTTVVDGLQALEAARANPPDLVVSDVMMPGLDGIGLLHGLRQQDSTREVPVVLLSARAGEEDRVAGLDSGADDYLVKPFHARELLASVRSHIKLSKLRREANESLRESESRFRHMADHSPVIIWVTEPDGSCTYLNKRWYEFTGTTPDETLGFGWLDSTHPADREQSGEHFLEANRQRHAFRLEYRLRRHDGVYRHVIDSAAPRFAADGRFLGFIGSVFDVTELKDTESELREADRRKDEFLAMLAHELRNPLAPIRTGLDILSLELEEPSETVELMQQQIAHLVRLVDDLLDVSRIARGKSELRIEKVMLSPIVDQAVSAQQGGVEEKRHELTLSLPGEPIWLDADPTRLSQVIGNLLANAIKYTDTGGRIWLTVEADSENVSLRLRDTGIGIDAELLPHVFDLFTQSSRSLDRSQGGLGIGLTLVRTLAEMHGGTVTAHSGGVGQGSEFVLRLPRAVPPEHTPAAVGDAAANESHRVLVVDDNVGAARMLEILLKKLDQHEVHTAHDGMDAITAFEELRPEVVLLDIGLPRMNGYEVARLIRDRYGDDVSLIALTGYGQDEDRRRSQAAGFDDHLVKPPSIEQLRAVLRSRRLRRSQADCDLPS